MRCSEFYIDTNNGPLKTNFYNDAYCRAGYEDDAKAVQSLWIDGKRDQAVARVPDEMVVLTNLIGTEDMIRERLRAFRDAGVDTFRLGTGGESWKDRTEALEEAADLIQREVKSWEAEAAAVSYSSNGPSSTSTSSSRYRTSR